MRKGALTLAAVFLTGMTALAYSANQPNPKGMTGKIQSISQQSFMMKSASGHDVKIMVNKGTRFAPDGYGMSRMTVGQKVWVTGTQGTKGTYKASMVTNVGGWDMWMTMQVDSVGSNSFTVDMMMGGGMMGNGNDMTVKVTSSTQWSPSGYSLSSMQPGDWVQISGTMTGWYTMEADSVTKSDGSGGGCGGGGGGMGGH
ncbi:MAG: DUF5666 domain-containing protein [Acidobacteriota bacterium]